MVFSGRGTVLIQAVSGEPSLIFSSTCYSYYSLNTRNYYGVLQNLCNKEFEKLKYGIVLRRT